MSSKLAIGTVFTPLEWGEFAVEKFAIFERWMKGATVFDPTMGTGDLLYSLVSYGLKNDHSLKKLPIHRIFGNELNTQHYQSAINRFKDDFNIDISNNFTNEDILTLSPAAYDIVLGNPPWVNFNDLPKSYKEEIKEHFFSYDLVQNSQNLLLGGSRIDIAALVIQCVIHNFIKPDGDALFFMPLSLLLNDGAHKAFRNYSVGDVRFAPTKIYDFNQEKIFHEVSTRYGLVHFKRDRMVSFPIDYYRMLNGKWIKHVARPIIKQDDPLSVLEIGEASPLENYTPIKLPQSAAPRQGINTCGANSIFFFTSYEQVDQNTCLVDDTIKLPLEFVHPLMVSSNFSETLMTPKKWVLLPYSSDGRPLTKDQIRKNTLLWQYLNSHQNDLSKRKGAIIGSWIKRGIWWALLGVGPYNFSNYKVVWEAYGKSTFRPALITKEWQVNQALQCYIPLKTKAEAKRVLKDLKNPAIEAYLLSMKMEGTMNWAQPGKMKKLLLFDKS